MSIEPCSSVSRLKSIPLTLQPSPITDTFLPSQSSILFNRTSIITIPLKAFIWSLVIFMLPIPMVISTNLIGLSEAFIPVDLSLPETLHFASEIPHSPIFPSRGLLCWHVLHYWNSNVCSAPRLCRGPSHLYLHFPWWSHSMSCFKYLTHANDTKSQNFLLNFTFMYQTASLTFPHICDFSTNSALHCFMNVTLHYFMEYSQDFLQFVVVYPTIKPRVYRPVQFRHWKKKKHITD